MSQKLVDYRSQHSIPEPVVPRSPLIEGHMLHQIENNDNSAMGVLRVEFNATRNDLREVLAQNEKLKAENEKLMTDKVNLKDETMQLKADAATLKEEYKEFEARDVKRARLDDEKHSWSTTAIKFYRKEIDGVVAREARTVARLDEARAKMQELQAILDPSRRV